MMGRMQVECFSIDTDAIVRMVLPLILFIDHTHPYGAKMEKLIYNYVEKKKNSKISQDATASSK